MKNATVAAQVVDSKDPEVLLDKVEGVAIGSSEHFISTAT